MARIVLLVLLSSVLACFRAAASDAGRATAATTDSAIVGGTSVVLFLAYQGPAHPSLDTARLHSWAWDCLVSAARLRGMQVHSRGALEPLLYKWRVRNSLGINSGFVNEVLNGLRSPQLLVADLTIYSDRMILLARRSSTATGELVAAGIVEAPLALPNTVPDLGQIIQSVQAASGSLLAALHDRTPAEPGREVYFLPTRRSGTDAPVAGLAGACVLRALLRTGWRIHDPGIAFTRLSAAGMNPGALDAKIRPELSGSEGMTAIIITDLAAYGLPSGSGPLLEGPEAPVTQFPSVALSLRWLDARTGDVIFASTEYIEPPQPRGLFGLARTSSLATRIQPAADRLVAKIKD